MQNVLLLRRLLEAVVDPEASRTSSEDAGAEMAELNARLGVEAGRFLPIDGFDGLRMSDLSPQAWLLLLEGRSEDEPEVPPEVLDAIYLGSSDPVLRFRLVSGALNQQRTRRIYKEALEAHPSPEDLEFLPDSWPKRRLMALDTLAMSKEDEPQAVQQGLAEMVLYLLQDGSEPALTLAAAAIRPADSWRAAARGVAQSVVGAADPNFLEYGWRFRGLGF
ncbi:MAG TPA: hypothetical protein VHZ26_08430 [Caulobacteraceae bacterium]|jgi:hypothetical protein|nr:hypothetical protein [Caulobacteraceae bacterium]